MTDCNNMLSLSYGESGHFSCLLIYPIELIVFGGKCMSFLVSSHIKLFPYINVSSRQHSRDIFYKLIALWMIVIDIIIYRFDP